MLSHAVPYDLPLTHVAAGYSAQAYGLLVRWHRRGTVRSVACHRAAALTRVGVAPILVSCSGEVLCADRRSRDTGTTPSAFTSLVELGSNLSKLLLTLVLAARCRRGGSGAGPRQDVVVAPRSWPQVIGLQSCWCWCWCWCNYCC